MIQKAHGRLPEITIKQILKQTGNSIRKLARMLEHLKELKEINSESEVGELLTVVANSILGMPR